MMLKMVVRCHSMLEGGEDSRRASAVGHPYCPALVSGAADTTP